MLHLRNLVLTAFFLLGIASATAQDSLRGPTVVVPPQFLKMLEAYKGWTPEYPEEPAFGNSVQNWAYRSHLVATSTLRAAARNWLFMQTEERFAKLVETHGRTVKALFGDVYLARGVHVVFSVPYGHDADDLYTAWYACMGRLEIKFNDGSNYLIGDRVLTWISSDRLGLAGLEGECRANLKSLSNSYGVEELTIDDLQAIGFLHRRFAAHQKNPKFLQVEVIRQAIENLFDPNK